MLATKPIGKDAAAKKYDLLTALGCYALSKDKNMQRLVLRLMVLITARYNWRRNELSMGRREIARIWAVEERTVKREMAKLRNLGWIRVKIPAARGRVAVYSIEFDIIIGATREEWPLVGPDFVLRMDSMLAPEPQHGGDVVPFPGNTKIDPPDIGDGSTWAKASITLHAQNPPLFGAWFKGLEQIGQGATILTLQAPSAFHAHYVETHYHGMILASIREQTQAVKNVVFTH